MWPHFQDASKAQFGWIGWRMPSSFRQGERISYKPVGASVTCLRETFDSILGGLWKVNGVCPKITWWNRAQGASHILSEQEIHKLRSQVFVIRENVLCIGVDSLETQVVHVLPYYLAHCKARSHQVYFREAFIVWKGCNVASLIIKIWHPLRLSEGYRRKCNSQLLGRTC